MIDMSEWLRDEMNEYNFVHTNPFQKDYNIVCLSTMSQTIEIETIVHSGAYEYGISFNNVMQLYYLNTYLYILYPINIRTFPSGMSCYKQKY